jgi:hypothetical protein
MEERSISLLDCIGTHKSRLVESALFLIEENAPENGCAIIIVSVCKFQASVNDWTLEPHPEWPQQVVEWLAATHGYCCVSGP